MSLYNIEQIDEELHYEEVNAILLRAESESSASQTHGVICGMICAGMDLEATQWVDNLLDNCPDQIINQESRLVIYALYSISLHQLHDMHFGFQLLLPHDDDDLENRVRALGEWCQGFITGISSAEFSIDSIDNEEAREMLNSILEIRDVDHQRVDKSNDDEHAYMELVEFIRVAVLLLYSECSDKGESGAQKEPTLH